MNDTFINNLINIALIVFAALCIVTAIDTASRIHDAWLADQDKVSEEIKANYVR